MTSLATSPTCLMTQQQQVEIVSVTASAPSPMDVNVSEEHRQEQAPLMELQHPPQHPTTVSKDFEATSPTLESASVRQQHVQQLLQNPPTFSAPDEIPSTMELRKPMLQQSLKRPPIEEKHDTQHPDIFSAPSDTTDPTFSTVPQEQI